MSRPECFMQFLVGDAAIYEERPFRFDKDVALRRQDFIQDDAQRSSRRDGLDVHSQRLRRQMRCVCALKADSLARKMFGTHVCGLRSVVL